MVLGAVSPAMAKEGNNGSNGCEKSNPNSKACENIPNSGEPILTVHYTTDTDRADVPGADCTVSNGGVEILSGTTDENGIWETYVDTETYGGTFVVDCVGDSNPLAFYDYDLPLTIEKLLSSFPEN